MSKLIIGQKCIFPKFEDLIACSNGEKSFSDYRVYKQEILILNNKLSVRVGEDVYEVFEPDKIGVTWAEVWEGQIIDGKFHAKEFVKSLT